MNAPLSSPHDLSPAGPSAGAGEPVVVADFASYAEAFERSLVVLAIGEAVWLESAAGRHRLCVASEAVEPVRTELACYEQEMVRWRTRPTPEAHPTGSGWSLTPLLWAVAVLAGFRLQQAWPAVADRGALDAAAVFQQHEWWRVATALFLHVDGAHLLSNAIAGIFVFSAVLAGFGRLSGWLRLALASLLGNAAAVAIHIGDSYRAIGASTAVFAALGLLSARSAVTVARSPHAASWRAIVLPVAAGGVVLGLYGAGGQHVDVVAHATGFAAGLIVGSHRRSTVEPRRPRPG